MQKLSGSYETAKDSSIPLIEESNIDWTSAVGCRKSSTLKSSNVRISDGGEHIVTLNDVGGVEREGDTQPGDRVVTDGRGQPYIIRTEKWDTLYEPTPDDTTVFRSKQTGMAIQLNQAVSIRRKDGETITTDPDGYLFKSFVTQTVNHITRSEYTRSYKVDPTVPLPVTTQQQDPKPSL